MLLFNFISQGLCSINPHNLKRRANLMLCFEKKNFSSSVKKLKIFILRIVQHCIVDAIFFRKKTYNFVTTERHVEYRKKNKLI